MAKVVPTRKRRSHLSMSAYLSARSSVRVSGRAGSVRSPTQDSRPITDRWWYGLPKENQFGLELVQFDKTTLSERSVSVIKPRRRTIELCLFSARHSGHSGTVNESYSTPSNTTCTCTIKRPCQVRMSTIGGRTSPSGFVRGLWPVASSSSAYAFQCGFAAESRSWNVSRSTTCP